MSKAICAFLLGALGLFSSNSGQPCTLEWEYNDHPDAANYAGYVDWNSAMCGGIGPGDRGDWFYWYLDGKSSYLSETYAHFKVDAPGSLVGIHVFQEIYSPTGTKSWKHVVSRWGKDYVWMPNVSLLWHPYIASAVHVRISGAESYQVRCWR